MGRSLGVDLLPPKTCTFDCIFCEVGRTTARTHDRREYVPVDEIMAEVDRWLLSGGTANYITLCGSGEPTLHSRFGAVIESIRRRTAIPVALLTNGSLLYLPEVRNDACRADLVKVSLSAWDASVFERLNAPNPASSFERTLAGLQYFRAQFDGELWLEVMVVAGINDDLDGMMDLAELAKTFRPDRIHLNTVIRPPAHGSARPVEEAQLRKFAGLFDPPAEVVAGSPVCACEARASGSTGIEAMLRRRPCTAEEIAAGLGASVSTVAEELRRLVSAGVLHERPSGGAIYYVCD